MYKVIGFITMQDLEKYLNDNAIVPAKIVGLAFSNSGHIVVVFAP